MAEAGEELDTSPLASRSIWIFGYGSLVHRPNFDAKNKIVGYIKGWKRVWYQGSTDHRGTPEHPGRTVTLHEDSGAVTWGVAYELAGDHKQQEEILKYLEWREKQYDIRHYVDVYGHDGNRLLSSALVYIASPDRTKNVNYLGPAPLEHIAQQIACAVGPSGNNWEYLYKLADAMREMKVNDPELYKLEAAVKSLREKQTVASHLARRSSERTPAEACLDEHATAAGAGSHAQHEPLPA